MTKVTAHGSTINLEHIETISKDVLQKIENNPKTVKHLEKDLHITTAVRKQRNGGIFLIVGTSTQDSVADIETSISDLKKASAEFIHTIEQFKETACAPVHEEVSQDHLDDLSEKILKVVNENSKKVGICMILTDGEHTKYVGFAPPIAVAMQLLMVDESK